MLSFALIAILIFALFHIVRVLIAAPISKQSLMELELEMVSLDAECTLAVQRSEEASNTLTEPNQNAA